MVRSRPRRGDQRHFHRHHGARGARHGTIRLFANAINDKVIASGGADLSGTVAVVVDSSYVPASGDTFDLVAGVINGTPLLSLPSLSGGLTWVTNNFLSAGQIAITSAGAPRTMLGLPLAGR